MPRKPKPVIFTFFASLPAIQSAISLDGLGDGARIKLDLPRTESGAAVLLQQKGAGKLLKVTIEVVADIKPVVKDDDEDEVLSRVLGN